MRLDTARGLQPTVDRDFQLLKLRMDVDGLTFTYARLKERNDKWNQHIMLITSFGALVTSIMTVANFVGWPYEIVPIVIQTLAGMMAGWMRFYDFPKRMEAIINAKHSSNDVREHLERSQAIDEAMWDQICGSSKMVDAVLTPEERERAHKAAFKYQTNEMKRNAKLHALMEKSNKELINMKDIDLTDKGSDSMVLPDLPRLNVPRQNSDFPLPKAGEGVMPMRDAPMSMNNQLDFDDGGKGERQQEHDQVESPTLAMQRISETDVATGGEDRVGSGSSMPVEAAEIEESEAREEQKD